MKLYTSIIAAAMAAGMISCGNASSSVAQADFEPLPFNEPTNLALAVVDDNAAYNYFTRDQWSALDPHVKGAFTPVGVCLLTERDSVIIALHDASSGNKTPLLSGLAKENDIVRYPEADKALADFDGAANCNAMTEVPCEPVALKAVRGKEIVNVDADLWYIPALGQLNMMADSKSKINDAIKAFGGDHIKNARYWSSTQCGKSSEAVSYWLYGFKDGYTGMATPGTSAYVRPVMDLQK